MMKLKGLCIGALALLVFSLLCWNLVQEETSCNVTGAGKESLNGYYAAYGGIYIKRGYHINSNPDIFTVFDLKRSVGTASTIIFSKHMWSIYDHMQKQIVYNNQPSNPDRYIYYPPKVGWKSAESSDLPAPVLKDCRGSLETSVPINANDASNIGQVFQRPITTLLSGIIFGFAYYLWAYRVDVMAVAFTYEGILLKAEYWRAITASFAHFDLLHLGFNSMALFSLGTLEGVYGSVTFLYLSGNLVIITMVLCTAMYHYMITHHGRTDLIGQPAVGYSCVLFAWMVALSARLKQYCPLFFLPNVCLDTWLIPLPNFMAEILGIPGFPVNLGPFLLLFLTKLIMPRSSFIGHMSGIIIGYPLAWNMLNWLTPPILISILVTAYVYIDRALVWTFPGYTQENCDLNDFVLPHLLRNYKIVHIMSYFALMSVVCGVYLMGWRQLLPRAVHAFVLWSAVHACRVEWITGLHSVREACSRLMMLAVLYNSAMILYDVCNLVSGLAAIELITGCGLSYVYVLYNYHFLGAMILIELVCTMLLLFTMHESRTSTPLLAKFLLDAPSVIEDVSILSKPCECCLPTAHTTTPFSGTANRLNPTSTSSTSSSSTRSNTNSNSSSHGNGSGGSSTSSSRNEGILYV